MIYIYQARVWTKMNLNIMSHKSHIGYECILVYSYRDRRKARQPVCCCSQKILFYSIHCIHSFEYYNFQKENLCMFNKRQILTQSTAHGVGLINVMFENIAFNEVAFFNGYLCNTNRIHSAHDCAVRPLCNTSVMRVVISNVTCEWNYWEYTYLHKYVDSGDKVTFTCCVQHFKAFFLMNMGSVQSVKNCKHIENIMLPYFHAWNVCIMHLM